MSDNEKCKWKWFKDSYGYDVYDTTCGHSPVMTNKNFKELEYTYCPFYSREIEEVKE